MSIIKLRLSLMMFLQFFIWGGWFVTLGTFLAQNLGANGAQTALAFSTQSWGAIIAPLFIGLVADRFFNAERLLAMLHLTGAVLMYLMYHTVDFASFYPLVLGYMLAYMPTLALVNSVSFGQLKQPELEFGQVRVWGTLGWIAAGNIDRAVGSLTYTQMLNDKAGIECDLTVTRIAEDEYYITTGKCTKRTNGHAALQARRSCC